MCAENIRPFHVQKVELLDDVDCPLRVEFVRWIHEARQNDSQSPVFVLLSAKIWFSKEGVFNTPNAHT